MINDRSDRDFPPEGQMCAVRLAGPALCTMDYGRFRRGVGQAAPVRLDTP
jgi:hypothetical protein